MSEKIAVSIVGGSGYTGGELLRLLLAHPSVTIRQVTSERLSGKYAHRTHPPLRKRSELKFSPLTELQECDVIFACLPHSQSMQHMPSLMEKAPRIIDLSADFRLKDPEAYARWYHAPHQAPQYLSKFVYGIPELHREEMRSAHYISSAGCNATATILGLYPLLKQQVVEPQSVVVEVKVGSSEAGAESNDGSHHPVRSHSLRSFQPTGHRHTAEILQEISFGQDLKVHFSATAIDMVRGVLATSHVFLNQTLDERAIWQIYREAYKSEPFVRIVKESQGLYRYPDPKLLWGTNYCDVGFEIDPFSNRLVVISAMDNLMKGAAGQALQAFNIMHGLEETLGLEFGGLHPI